MAVGFAHNPMPVFSLKRLASCEADAHKWLLSEQTGRDVGPHGRRDWYCRFWRPFCRYRLLEHLQGVCWYEEFSAESFGRLRDPHLIQMPAMQFIITYYLEYGWENLQFMVKAPEQGFTAPELHEPLKILDVNSAHIDPDGV